MTFELMELSWPEPGKKLFEEGGDRLVNSCLNLSWDEWFGYIEGYRLAGTLLVAHVEQEGVDQDTLVYPIVFAFRQYLELQMKELIEAGSALLDVDSAFKTTHDLVHLWADCRVMLEQVFGAGAESTRLDGIEEQIAQLSAVDPMSMTFRYPVDKRGAPSLPAELTGFNIRFFADRIEEIANFLGGASTGIAVYRDWKADMRAEMGHD